MIFPGRSITTAGVWNLAQTDCCTSQQEMRLLENSRKTAIRLQEKFCVSRTTALFPLKTHLVLLSIRMDTETRKDSRGIPLGDSGRLNTDPPGSKASVAEMKLICSRWARITAGRE